MNQLVRQIELDRPGVMVCNFHPENITVTRELHEAAVAAARRPGWIALGLESYLRWLEMMEGLTVRALGSGRFLLTSSDPVQSLVLRYPMGTGWRRQNLLPWKGQREVTSE